MILELKTERSAKVFAALVEARRTGQLSTLISPEVEFRPSYIREGSIEHSQWLSAAAFACRHGDKTRTILRKLKALCEEMPYLIDPRNPLSQQRELFEPMRQIIPFADHKNQIFRERVDWYYRYIQQLRSEFNSDPRQIILSLPFETSSWTANRQALIASYSRFKGIGEKLAQLFGCWHLEVNWPEDQEIWQRWRSVPLIAADMWFMRLVRQTDLVSSYRTDLMTKIAPILSEKICDICWEHQLPANEVLQAMWHVGSFTCGKGRPKNGRYRDYCLAFCPLVTFCVGLIPAHYKWRNGERTTNAKIGWDNLRPHPPSLVDEIVVRS